MPRRSIPLLSILLLAGALSSRAAAAPRTVQAQAVRTPADSTRPVATATRIPNGAITLDGRLDESAWDAAIPITDFTQVDPAQGQPATQRTSVFIVYDDEALYVGARMYSRHPAEIQAPVSRRDEGGQAEHLTVSLDTYLDRRTAYSFGITASGVRIDYYQPEDNDHSRDESYDPVWEAEAERTSYGWTAEMRIPFSQLRFNDLPRQLWGLNLDRWSPSIREDDYWIAIPHSVQAWSSRFGNLEGIAGITPSRRLELVPYVASSATAGGQREPGDPFRGGGDLSARVGGDLKMGLGPNLTLEGTINPDFGQVEADPAEVNLSAFETFFDERRPFFIEGSSLLSGDGPGYFYSRRIGAAPRGPLPDDATFADVPPTSTILGAGKLTGRLGSGTSVAALVALTGREFARTFDALAPPADAFGRAEVAPRSVYGVARVQQELGQSGSTAGLILTGVGRDLANGSPVAAEYDRSAFSGGGDWRLRLGSEGAYELSGYAGFSHVAGDPAALLELQESSARYFQRPDADYVRVDSTRTSLAGYTGALRAERISGRHWLWEIGASAESPGFELNDAGRLSQADDIQGDAELHYRETLPGAHFREYDLGISSNQSWTFGGANTENRLEGDADFTFPNYWQAGVSGSFRGRALSPTLTRGGPLMGTPQAWEAGANVGNDFTATARWESRVNYQQDEDGGRELRVSASFTGRPSPPWQISVEPSFTRATDPRQFIADLDNGPAATFGRRYVFATTARSTIATQFRVNYAFRPGLTLEMYAEPFAASVHFRDYGELEAARGRALRLYRNGAGTTVDTLPDGSLSVTDAGQQFTLDASDFLDLSFRSDAVLRWEWRPGSTFFLVWQQNRRRDDPAATRAGAGDLFDALRTPGENIFAVKASFWLPVR